ncbi:MAG TPA: GspE/PulE family protein [Opitutaceae bacterium]|nr:GspE/PulE family protein [Opitutaceae bacterium]
MREHFELLSPVWRGDQRLALSRALPEPLANGYLLEADALAEAFESHRIYPVALSSTIDADAVLLFAAWLAANAMTFDSDAMPWVPIGAVGPVLILGHVNLELRSPPLPWGTFQPVCLQVEDYERQLSKVAMLLEGRVLGEAIAAKFGSGIGRFPPTVVMPTDRPNALRFLQEYFLMRSHEATMLARMLSAGSAAYLDSGYEAAVRFVLAQCAVATLAPLRCPETAQQLLPEALRKKITVVAELDRHLWCAATTLPQAEAEDRLYAELGQGWTIHWLLRTQDAEGMRPPTVSEGTGASPVNPSGAVSGTNTPFKIVLPGQTAARTTKADVIEAEERLVVLDEKDWSRFDPRHRDSAEPESLWKWAIFKSLRDGATDLHIEPGATTTRVRQRIDGLLEEILEVPTSVGEGMVYSLMTQVGLGSDKYRPVDGSFQIELIAKVLSRNQSVRVRANAYPVRGVTQKIALRFLPRQGAVPALEHLMPMRQARLMNRAISRPEGLILVCGPTGSGKTTTIFSALSVLNRAELNVTTLENPVEILLDGTNQAEINSRRNVTWAALNRAFLRQDPDVGLIGEIRDEDTAKTILRAALTGHLVFGSLHTKSCPTSVIRMTDLGADANMLAESLILVVCQRLIRRVCPKCREEYAPTQREQALFSAHGCAVPTTLFRPSAKTVECDHCRNRGYRGRLAAIEVLPNVPTVRRLIEERAPSQAYSDWMAFHGLPTVFENALELAATGATTVEEALTLQDAWEGDEWANFN